MRLLFVLYMRSSDILRGDFRCENFLIEDYLILTLEEIFLVFFRIYGRIKFLWRCFV